MHIIFNEKTKVTKNSRHNNKLASCGRYIVTQSQLVEFTIYPVVCLGLNACTRRGLDLLAPSPSHIAGGGRSGVGGELWGGCCRERAMWEPVGRVCGGQEGGFVGLGIGEGGAGKRRRLG